MLKLFTYAQSLVADRYYTLRENEKGQTMAEYGVILAVITVGIVLALGVLSGAIQTAIGKVSATLTK